MPLNTYKYFSTITVHFERSKFAKHWLGQDTTLEDTEARMLRLLELTASYLVVLCSGWRWWGRCFLLSLGVTIVRGCVRSGVASISGSCCSSCDSYRSRPGNRNCSSCWGIGSGNCVSSYRGLMDSVASNCSWMRVGYTRSWLLAIVWSRRINIIQFIKN